METELTFHVTGTRALLMHNPQLLAPQNSYARQIKSYTAKRKKTDEDYIQVADLEWIGGIYLDEENRVVLPASHLRKALINAAKITKQGTAVERALTVTAVTVPLTYDGPKDINEMGHNPAFRSMLPVVVNGKRLMRCRPMFSPPWSLHVPAMLIYGAGLNTDELERIAMLAGKVSGLGDGRNQGYGRFEVEIEWKDSV